MSNQSTADLIARYHNFNASRGLAPATMSQNNWALSRLLTHCPELPCTEDDVLRVLGDPKLSLESRKGLRKCLKTFFLWLERRHDMPNPCAQLPPLPRRQELPRVLTVAEIRRLKQAAQSPRDCALVLLPLDTGLRLGEIAGLRRQDIGDGWLRVKGKVGVRQVPVSEGMAARLLALGDEYYIWTGRRGPLSRFGVSLVYPRLFRQAGIVGKKTGAHTLRHTFATWYIRGGGSQLQLQSILGHKDGETTRIYVTLAGQDVKADHARHSPIRTLGLLPEQEKEADNG